MRETLPWRSFTETVSLPVGSVRDRPVEHQFPDTLVLDAELIGQILPGLQAIDREVGR